MTTTMINDSAVNADKAVIRSMTQPANESALQPIVKPAVQPTVRTGTSEMTAARKLSWVRASIAQKGVGKSGASGGAGYKFTYFELSDFLPLALSLMHKVGLTTDFTIEDKMATMHVINTDETTDYLTFRIPTASVALNTPIQSLGAVVSYLRRYLWIIVLEISEADVIDGYDQDKLKAMQVRSSS